MVNGHDLHLAAVGAHISEGVKHMSELLGREVLRPVFTAIDCPGLGQYLGARASERAAMPPDHGPIDEVGNGTVTSFRSSAHGCLNKWRNC